jgi:hypothetical protein
MSKEVILKSFIIRKETEDAYACLIHNKISSRVLIENRGNGQTGKALRRTYNLLVNEEDFKKAKDLIFKQKITKILNNDYLDLSVGMGMVLNGLDIVCRRKDIVNLGKKEIVVGIVVLFYQILIKKILRIEIDAFRITLTVILLILYLQFA